MIDCNNMDEQHVCNLDECTCGYTKGRCEEMVCKDYSIIENDGLDTESAEELAERFRQLNILKEKLDGVHSELNNEGNKYAAAFLGVDIDELQHSLENWNKPLQLLKTTTLNEEIEEGTIISSTWTTREL